MRNIPAFAAALLLVAAALLATGCPRSEPAATPASDSASSMQSVAPLTLVVVDDSPLATAIERLKADWKSLTGATLEVVERSGAELIDNQLGDADAIVYPSANLGLLAERKRIIPPPAHVLESPELAWSEIFEVVQLAEVSWGQTTLAIPFGSPVLTCCYRQDLFEKFERKPPETWEQYQVLAAFFSDRKNLGDAAPADDVPWSGAIEPLGDGWGSRTLLARAAPYAKHRDNYSTLFNIDDMAPLVAGPAFTRALEEMVAAHKLQPSGKQKFDPAGARSELLGGHCAMALTWPTGAADASGAKASKLPIGWAELPGSPKVYNANGHDWESRVASDPGRVPLLASAGRLGSVSSDSQHAEDAFRLLIWLAGKQWSSRVCAASSQTTLFRQSHVLAPAVWVEAGLDPKSARQYADLTAQTLARQSWLFAPRLPGQERYLAALDAAVAAALLGEQSPSDALAKAADAWSQITEQIGHDSQRGAYRRSLGLDQ